MWFDGRNLKGPSFELRKKFYYYNSPVFFTGNEGGFAPLLFFLLLFFETVPKYELVFYLPDPSKGSLYYFLSFLFAVVLFLFFIRSCFLSSLGCCC